MFRASLAVALLLLLAACSSFSDVEPYDKTLPTVDLKGLAGQEVVLDLRTERDVAIVSGRLHDDLRRAFEANGVKLVEKGPLVMSVKFGDIRTRYRIGMWESCGNLTAELLRDGTPAARRIVSDYCSEVTANPGEPLWTRRATRGEIDAYERAYFGILHAFFNDLEQTLTAATPATTG